MKISRNLTRELSIDRLILTRLSVSQKVEPNNQFALKYCG